MAITPMPVMNGLICWLDFRDGNNTDKTATWIDRSGNGNHGILENFSFTTDAWQSDGFQFKKGASVKIPNLTRSFSSITAQFHAVNVVTGSSGMEVAFHGDYRNDIRKLTTHLTHTTGVCIDSRGVSNTVYDRATNATTTHFASVDCLVTLSTKLGEVRLMRDSTTVLTKAITESSLNLAVSHALFGNDSNFKSKFLLIYDRPLTDAEILHNINFGKIMQKKDWFTLTMKQKYANQSWKATENLVPKPRLKFTAEGYTNYLPLQRFVPPEYPPTEPIKTGLICWLDGRDGNNTDRTSVWVDRSGNGNNVDLTTLSYNATSGWNGGALCLDGTKDFVDKTLNQLLEGSFYVEVRFRLKNAPTDRFGRVFALGKRDGTVTVNTTGYQICIGTDSTYQSKIGHSYYFDEIQNLVPRTGTIQTFGFCKNLNVDNRFYLEGALQTTKTNNLGASTGYKTFLINSEHASSNASYPYKNDMEIFSIKIYNRALTPAEIQHNYKYENQTMPSTKKFQLSFFDANGVKYNPRQYEWTEFNITSNIYYEKQFSNLFFTEGLWFRTIATGHNGIRKGYIELKENVAYDVTFDWSVSSEATNDNITFKTRSTLDTTDDWGSSIFARSGSGSGTFTYSVTDPTQKYLYFYWRKDGSVSSGTDSGYIKNIKITRR